MAAADDEDMDPTVCHIASVFLPMCVLLAELRSFPVREVLINLFLVAGIL